MQNTKSLSSCCMRACCGIKLTTRVVLRKHACPHTQGHLHQNRAPHSQCVSASQSALPSASLQAGERCCNNTTAAQMMHSCLMALLSRRTWRH
jgi:hypothetical protein